MKVEDSMKRTIDSRVDSRAGSRAGAARGEDGNTKIEKECSSLLREIRRRKGLTLNDFEELSGGTVKAVVLGSYERGTRAISLARLEQIATIYEVPIQYFFTGQKERESASLGRLIFDLRRIARANPEELPLLAIKKMLGKIVRDRADWNGEVLSIRARDGEILEMMTDIELDTLKELLREHHFLWQRLED